MKKSVFGLLLGVIVLFMAISPNFIAQAEELENEAKGNVVESVAFLANGNPVSDGDTVSLKDEFQVEYRLASPLYMNYSDEDKEEGHIYLAEGDVIELPKIMSTGFDLSEIGEFALDLDDGTNFGTVSVSSSGEVKLTVNYSDNKNVYDVVVGLTVSLDSKVIEDKQQYTFEIPGVEPRTVTVNIEENVPETPSTETPTPAPGPKKPSYIKKYASFTEPEKHQITWTILVNEDWNELTNASVTEKLGDGQKFVSVKSVKVYDSKWKVVASDIEPVEVAEGEYRFDFGDLLNGNRAVINVVTELTDEEITNWEANRNKYYKNSAILSCDQFGELISTSDARCKWKDDILQKSGKVNETTKKVDYKVILNAGGQTLPDGVVIKDILGKSLSFDPDSIKIYLGKVNPTTKEVELGDIIAQEFTKSITNDGDNEVLTIIAPELKGLTCTFVLVYTAVPKEIRSDGDYTNTAELYGYGEEEIKRVEEVISYKNFGGGRAEDPKKPNKPTPTPTPAPTPTPKPSNPSNGGGGSSSSSSSSSSTPNKVVGYGETVISIGSDIANNGDATTINDDAVPTTGGANTLAKTGGFIGTIAAYVVGIILIIGGGIVAFGGRKKVGNEK